MIDTDAIEIFIEILKSFSPLTTRAYPSLMSRIGNQSILTGTPAPLAAFLPLPHRGGCSSWYNTNSETKDVLEYFTTCLILLPDIS